MPKHGLLMRGRSWANRPRHVDIDIDIDCSSYRQFCVDLKWAAGIRARQAIKNLSVWPMNTEGTMR